MAYKGLQFTFPLVAAGLGFLRNPLVVPPGIMENIRNCNIHELGVGKRGGTSIFDAISGDPRLTGLKQFISAEGDEYILRATEDGKYWKNNTETIKTGLSIRGDEALAQGDFTTDTKWAVVNDMSITGNEAVYAHSIGNGSLEQALDDLTRPLKANTLYELSYVVSGVVDTPICQVSGSVTATSATNLTLSAGAQTTQFTTKSDFSSFRLITTVSSGTDAYKLDDLSLKEVIAPPVDISIYSKYAIFTNGRDVPQVFTGLRFLDAPAAPVIGNAGEGVGDCEDGTHLVKVTFINSSGETPGSHASNQVTVTDQAIDGKIKVLGIPIGPNEVTGRSIYMTEAGGSTYYKVTTGTGATIGDNTTIEYEIDVDDITLAGYNTIPSDNTAATGDATTDLGIEGISAPGALVATLEGASAPTAERAGLGAGNVDDGGSGEHSYIVVFIDADRVHSKSGSKSNVITIVDKAVDGQVSLTNIAIGPEDTVAREIYRTTQGDISEHFHLATIGDNTTTTYIDNIADADLGEEIITNSEFGGIGVPWAPTGLFTISGGNASYAHVGGPGADNGTLIQTVSSMVHIPESNHAYELEYTISNTVAEGNITTFRLVAGFDESGNVDLDTGDGTHTKMLTSKVDGVTSFTILTISTDNCSFDLDDIFVRETVDPGVSIGTGEYSYKATFLNLFGETVGGEISNVVTTTAENARVLLTDIPIGPRGVIARNIYRTDADGSTYTFLTTIGDNTTTTYLDKIADANLGGAIPTSNTAAARPSDWIGTNNPKYAFEHAVGNTEGIIFFGCEENPDQVYIIPDGSEDASDANIKQFTFKTKNIRGKNVLVGGVEYGTNLFMFSNDSSWLMDKSSLDIADWTYIKLPWKGGTINNKTLVVVNNDIHSMELDGNIYSIKRVQESGDTSLASLTRPTITRPQSIDRWIRENIDLSYSDDFHGVFDEELQAVHWFMVREGQTKVDNALTYFVAFDRWVVSDNTSFNSGFSASVSTVFVNIVGTKTVGTGDYSGNVWLTNQVAKSDNSNGYWGGFKLHPTNMPANDIVRNRSYDTLFIKQEVNAGVDLEVQGFVDEITIPAKSIESSQRYTRYQFGRIGRAANVEIYNDTAGEDFFIEALIFYYELLDTPSE